MEIKINREIRDYHESMFMGLSLRQTLCSLLAVGAAVGLYFWLNPILGTEAVSWVCMIGAAPFCRSGICVLPRDARREIPVGLVPFGDS